MFRLRFAFRFQFQDANQQSEYRMIASCLQKRIMRIVCNTRFGCAFWTRQWESKIDGCRVVCAPTVFFIHFVCCRAYSFSHSIIRMRWVWFGSNFNVTRISVEIDAVIIQLDLRAIRYWQWWIDAILRIIVFFICWCYCWMLWMIIILHSIVIMRSRSPAIKWFVDTKFMNDPLLLSSSSFYGPPNFTHILWNRKRKCSLWLCTHARTHNTHRIRNTHHQSTSSPSSDPRKKQPLCIIITNVYASNYICTSFYVNFDVCM